MIEPRNDFYYIETHCLISLEKFTCFPRKCFRGKLRQNYVTIKARDDSFYRDGFRLR